jgi:hypothetical protein
VSGRRLLSQFSACEGGAESDTFWLSQPYGIIYIITVHRISGEVFSLDGNQRALDSEYVPDSDDDRKKKIAALCEYFMHGGFEHRHHREKMDELLTLCQRFGYMDFDRTGLDRRYEDYEKLGNLPDTKMAWEMVLIQLYRIHNLATVRIPRND